MPATDSDLPLVITMWETYGSNMEPVAARVGQLLGIPVYAQAFSSEDIEALAEEDTDGRAAKLTQRLSTGATPAEMSSHEVAAAGKAHARECTSFVTEKAQGGGVIQGRNGAYILRNRPNTLHVKLDGIPEKRVERAARLAGISLARAARRQRMEDAIRVETSLLSFGVDPRDIELYDVVLNTTFQNTEETARVIAALARIRQGVA
ncbi:MAG: cytidylate kinase-like family protein [Actinomycetales bacterium]|nr:cytidylate kinase-like family protein [Actinomycetales bacterium]